MNLLEKYDKVLSCILIGNNIVNLTAATLGTVLFTVVGSGLWSGGLYCCADDHCSDFW